MEGPKTWKETLETQYPDAFDKKAVNGGKPVLVLPIESDEGKHGTLDKKALGDYIIIADDKVLSIIGQDFDIDKVDFEKFSSNLSNGKFTEVKPRVANEDPKSLHFTSGIYKDGLTDSQNFYFIQMNPSNERTWESIKFQASERQKINREKLQA